MWPHLSSTLHFSRHEWIMYRFDTCACVTEVVWDSMEWNEDITFTFSALTLRLALRPLCPYVLLI